MLQTINLTKRYDNIEALSNVNIRIEKGSIFVLLGSNGAGKTTLLKIFATLLKPTSGQAFVNNLNVVENEIEVRRIIGYLPEIPHLYDHLTGYEFIRFIGILKDMDENKLENRISYLFREWNLEDKMHIPIGNYSKGMKQKIAIIQAIISEPKTLLLDEPIVGLDPEASIQLKKFFRDFVSNGGTIFLTTHLTDFAESICTSIGIIHRGNLRFVGTLEDLYKKTNRDTIEEAFVGIVSA